MRPSNVALWLLLISSLALTTCKTVRSRPSYSANNNSSPVKYAPSTETLRQNSIDSFKGKADELWEFHAPRELNPKARIKGKIAFLWRTSNGIDMHLFDDKNSKVDKKTLDYYGFKEDEIAIKVDEIDTLIKVWCLKGDQIGEYQSGRAIPAYAKECDVDVIDYRNRTTFAEREIINRKMERTVEISINASEYILEPPFDQIRKYLKSLKSK